jgi:hypothetical protein
MMDKICSVCKNVVPHFTDNSKQLCPICYKKQYKYKKEKCWICEKVKVVNARDEGKPVCKICYRKYYQKKEECFYCKEIKTPDFRTEKGEAVCNKCYTSYLRPKNKCNICGEVNYIEKIQDGYNICIKCYKNPKSKCDICGKDNKKINKIENGKKICISCYKVPIKKCIKCLEEKPVCSNDKKGPICRDCYKPPTRKCIKCHRENIIIGFDRCRQCFHKYKIENDERYRTTILLKDHFRHALKNYADGKKYSRLIYGIDYKAIIEYLGPCPGWREDYHIDHIFPISAFDLSNLKHIQACFAAENHRWLKKEDNLSKGDKFNKEDFEEYLKKFK